MNTVEKITESNRIEGIIREVRPEEITEFERFTGLPSIGIEDISNFVGVYQPGAKLRNIRGLDVRVGTYFPPRGGPEITAELLAHLTKVNRRNWRDAWILHLEYEKLHPFTDGNGRSGRMLWYWIMGESYLANLGFLHAFYYQTLKYVPTEKVSNE